jgi:phosphoadenosine phosphosulfate reductase
VNERLQGKAITLAFALRQIAAEHAPVALASSLGAEDMLLTDLILRHDLDIEIFTLDTGRLHPETLAQIDAIERSYGYRLAVYQPRLEAVDEYARAHGVDAFYTSIALRKQCCGIRKVEPLRRALLGKSAWITGLRRSQAVTRHALAEREFDAVHGIPKFNPLAGWSDADIWAYLRAFAVPTNPLHARGYPSIGCAPCTRAVAPGEDPRAGRWWWEQPETKECGLHTAPDGRLTRARLNTTRRNATKQAAAERVEKPAFTAGGEG